jgi:hypothetical protein
MGKTIYLTIYLATILKFHTFRQQIFRGWELLKNSITMFFYLGITIHNKINFKIQLSNLI